MSGGGEPASVYHVLLAIDGDEDRLERQLDTLDSLPGREEIRATVLYVHEEVDVPGGPATVIEAINRELDELQGVPDVVYDAVDALDEMGIETETAAQVGKPAERILDAADELDLDVILIAGRNRSPAGKAIFGSVTQGVIIDSDRPVLVAS